MADITVLQQNAQQALIVFQQAQTAETNADTAFQQALAFSRANPSSPTATAEYDAAYNTLQQAKNNTANAQASYYSANAALDQAQSAQAPQPDPAVAKEDNNANSGIVSANNINTTNTPVTPSTDVAVNDSLSAGESVVPASQIKYTPGEVPAEESLSPGEQIVSSPNNVIPADIQAMLNDARQQAVRSVQAGQDATSTDWRVKLSLAQGADYLYNAGDPGILQPLQVTGGVIFPYTPKIDLTYKAQYSPYELTHSNYKGYFYQSSMVDAFSVTGMFTAQSTADATYLLAVIHFFRSVTKMFYGQDAQRGSPPPLVFLSGLGDYQFNNHPCLVSQFTYSLPDDVDYIRAQYSNNANLNQTAQNNVQQYAAINSSAISSVRLNNAGINPGAMPPPLFGGSSIPNLAQGSPTYVPTKMSISITLLPVNTRQQVSQQFSLTDYATGSLLRGGYW